MQPIYYEVDGKPVCLVVDASTASIINKDQYQLILPYVVNQFNAPVDCKLENNMIKITSNDQLINEENLSSICYKCMNNLSEKIIVPQTFNNGLPDIRHRPLHFSVSDDKSGIVVRFEELGKFNSFEKAIMCL